MSQAISARPFNAEARVRIQASARQISVEQFGTGTDVSEYHGFSL